MTPTAAITDRNRTHDHPTAPVVALLDAIAAAPDPASVAEAGRRLPRTVIGLVRSGVDPLEIGGIVSGAIDAMSRRLIDLGISEIGDPPVPWAWLALGSAARREQGIGTDQDHALAYDPLGRPLDELDEYFRRLAEYVTSGLEGAGIPRCHADVMAVNQALRRPVEHWVEAFRTWMADPRIEAVRQTTILFDHRRVAGSLDIERTLSHTIASSPDRGAFVGRLKEMALEARPRRHVRLPRRIDLKHDGLMQIVSLARVLAVEGDIAETGTIERLRRAAQRGLLDEGSSQRLAAAFQVIWRIRLEHQISAAAGGEEPGDLVHVGTAEIRRQLREAFGAVRDAQDALVAAVAAVRRSSNTPLAATPVGSRRRPRPVVVRAAGERRSPARPSRVEGETLMNRAVALGLLVALPIAACTSSAGATCRPQGTELRLVAEGHSFGTDCLAAPADREFTIAFRNEDTSPHGAHNIAIYREDGVAVFTGKTLGPGGTSVVYEVQPLAAWTYTFRCDNHTFMDGAFIAG